MSPPRGAPVATYSRGRSRSPRPRDRAIDYPWEDQHTLRTLNCKACNVSTQPGLHCVHLPAGVPPRPGLDGGPPQGRAPPLPAAAAQGQGGDSVPTDLWGPRFYVYSMSHM